MTKASDIARSLSAKYSGEEWRIWFEVSQGTGYNSGRRADAVAMNIWPSKGYQIHVFEIKVSRNDFKKEMENLEKWKAVGKYADFFWLVAPTGLIKEEELPVQWGLMQYSDKSEALRIKKQAPALDPVDLDRGFAASLLRSGESLTQKEIDKRVYEGVAAEVENIEKRAKDREDARYARKESELQRLSEWQKAFEEKFGFKPQEYAPVDKAIQKIKVAETLEFGQLSTAARTARQFADLVDALKD